MLNTSMESNLRRWMRLCEFFTVDAEAGGGSHDEPHIQWRMINASTAIIDRFELPEGKRSQGIGTAYYQNWEKNLPPAVHAIELWAKNPDAMRFWQKMGYAPKHDMEQNVEADGVVMWKHL